MKLRNLCRVWCQVTMLSLMTNLVLSTCSNCTEFSRSFERILSRKRRYLIFPKGANIICTLSVVKAVVITSPRGYNFLGEVDFFYPLPDKVMRHKKKKPATTTTTTLAPPPEHDHPHDEIILDHPPDDHHHDDHADHADHDDHSHDHPGEIWVPDGGWKSDIIGTLASFEPPGDNVTMAERRIWNNSLRQWQNAAYFGENMKLRTPYANRYQPPMRPFWKPANNYSPVSYNQNMGKWRVPQNYAQKWLPSPVQRKSWTNWRPPPLQNQYSGRKYFVPKGRSLKVDNETKAFNIDDHQDWEYYHAHRDRRDLYKSIVDVFHGIEVKSCILRTICEARHFLLPPGKSLFQDIFRILFSIPVKDGYEDDFSNAMRSSKEDCVLIYAKNCPISVLEILLNGENAL